MIPRIASLTLALCAAATGCGARTLLDDIEVDGDDPASPSASSSTGTGTGTGTPGDACPALNVPAAPPLLWYPLDGDFRSNGTLGGGLFEGGGYETEFVVGIAGGGAVEVARPGGGVELFGSLVAFGDVGAMTLTLWFLEPDAPGLEIPIFSNRAAHGGLQLLRGVESSTLFFCWGDAGTGTCDSFPLAAGGWHLLVLRRTSETSDVVVDVDAAQVAVLPTAGLDLFADAGNLLLGDARIGELEGTGRIRIDDMRLYDRRLGDGELCQELGAFWCEPGCDLTP